MSNAPIAAPEVPAHLDLSGLANHREIPYPYLTTLAARASVSVASVSAVNNGRMPGPRVMRSLCCALGVTEAQLRRAVLNARNRPA